MSYPTRFGSPSRASRVDVPARCFSSFSRLTAVRQRPVYVVLNRAGDCAAVAYPGGYGRVDAAGWRYRRRDENALVALTMLDSTFFENGQEMGLDGSPGVRDFAGGSLEWALDVRDETVAWVRQGLQSPYMQTVMRDGVPVRTSGMLEAALLVSSERFFNPERRVTEMVWAESFPGTGCGAISGNRVAVALKDGRFIVLDTVRSTRAHPKDHAHGLRLAEAKLPLAAYELSILDGGYGLLAVSSPGDAETLPFSPLASAVASEARRVELSTVVFPRWKTAVFLLDESGHEKAHVELPFEVFQPPVDGGAGRVYLLGMGMAALQDGKLLYAHPSEVPIFATAFADGTLALAVGPELRIVDRDGTTKQTFTTPEHEALTTPPAVAWDGTLWVGSEKALYVAR